MGERRGRTRGDERREETTRERRGGVIGRERPEERPRGAASH